MAFLAALGLLAGLWTPRPPQRPMRRPKLSVSDLGGFADRFFARQMAARHVPGAVFVVVRRNEVLLAKGYGWADRERRIAVEPEHTLFRVASVTKLLTATAAMQLVESGRLGLDDPVNQHLRLFQLAANFAQPVRVRHLLTHTAGFDERLIGVARRTPPVRGDLGRYLAHNMPARLLPPETTIGYSNHGMALLGRVIENVSGREFSDYVTAKILAPLEMRRSGFRPDPAQRADLANGHAWRRGRYRIVPFDYSNVEPAGGLVATGADMARFLMSHLADHARAGGRILRPQTMRAMHRQQFTHDRELQGVALGFFERFQNGQRMLEHGGDVGGFASLACLVPAHGLGFFVSYNRDTPFLREDLVREFLDRYFPIQRVRAPPPEGAAERIVRIAGAYRWNRYARATLAKLASLQVRVRGCGRGRIRLTVPFGVLAPMEYAEVAPYRFRQADGDGMLVFDADGPGATRRMFLSAFGLPLAFDRLASWETLDAHAFGLGLVILVFLSTLLVLPGRIVSGRRRRARTLSACSKVGMVVSVLGLVTVAGMVAVIWTTPLERFGHGVPWTLVVFLLGGCAAATLSPVLLGLVAMAWYGRVVPLAGRLHATLVAFAAVLFVVLLDYWNLLGLRY